MLPHTACCAPSTAKGGGFFDDPLVFVPPTYHCLHSSSGCCFPFGATNMSTTTAPLYGRDVIAKLSATLVHLSGAANLMDARVGHLQIQKLADLGSTVVFEKFKEEFENSKLNVFPYPAYQNFFQVTDIYTNASHAAGIRVQSEGADGGWLTSAASTASS